MVVMDRTRRRTLETICRAGAVAAPALLLLVTLGARAEPAPPDILRLAPELLDATDAATLGVVPAPGTETHSIFRPGPADDAYAHGVVLVPFRGRLHAQWQSSRRDEDGPDTRVMFAVSDDGEHWSEPRELASTLESGIRTSGGWWTDGQTLVAYINEWPALHGAPRGGRTLFRSSEDGEHWSALQPVRDAAGAPVMGVIEQDPRALPDGRILGAFHEQPGLQVSPWTTPDPLGVNGWRRGRMPRMPSDDPHVSRELEPSWFLRPGDGAVVMVFRDQASSYRKLASVSRDAGRSWSRPVLTGVPDARTKQSAGNLPGGAAFLVGNPRNDRERHPLVLLLSENGWCFDRAWLLRGGGDELPALRFEGRYKRSGYSYPKSVLWNEVLYVAYATNKEDVELTRVPVSGLLAGTHSTACR